MSNWLAAHPGEGLLLRYLDGELPVRKTRAVRRHVEACWQCRACLKSLETTVADCVEYRQHVLAAHLPAPPAAWADLQRSFEEVDAALAAGPFWKHLLPVPRAWQWSAAAVAAAALVIAAYVQLRQAPAVQAAGLLRKAMAAADLHHPTGAVEQRRREAYLLIDTAGMRKAR